MISMESPRTVEKSNNSDASLLSVTNLSVSYASRQLFRALTHVHALKDVNLEIRRGERFGVVGESGSGKSTLARTIIGLVRPSAGEIRMEGEVLRSPKHWKKIYPLKIQMVSQDPFGSLDPGQRILDSMLEPLVVNHLLASRTESIKKIEELFQNIGLRRDLLSSYPHQLSGGQRQRVAIARAVMMKPQLLILDEPTSALDVSTQAQIVDLLKQLQSDLGFTYLFISHNLQLVWHVCDNICVIKRGQIVEMGRRDTVYNSPTNEYTRQLIGSIRS